MSMLVEFNSHFKISFSIKTRTIMTETEEIILLTLILRNRCRKKRNYSATRSKPRF